MATDDSDDEFLTLESEDDTIGSQKPIQESKMSSKEIPMCRSCVSEKEKEKPLSGYRDKWPIGKIENNSIHQICILLDLADRSKVPLMNALGGFDQITAAYIKTKYGERGGVGTAEEVLNKWASRNRENNNVGALKKILEDTMQRDDVVEEIEKWEKLSVCHGCGIRLNKPYRMVTIVADEKPRTSVQEASSRSASMSRPRTRGGPYERESSVSGGPGFSGRPSGFERRYRGGGRGRYGGMRSGSGNNSDRNAAAAGFNAVPSASAFNTGGFGGATHSFGNIGSVTASTGYGGTQANAMGNSGFFGDSGVGAFVSQSGGVGHQAVQNYTNVVNFNLGTSISQEGNEWQGSN